MITDSELKKLHEIAENHINSECEHDFNLWRDQCLKSLDSLVKIPDGLNKQLEIFIQDKKHLFFRSYRERIIERVTEGFKRPSYNVLPSSFKPLTSAAAQAQDFPLSFNDRKNRLFLETYLSCNENSRRAAEKLGVAKSTFHDWKQQHVELIESEKRKTCALY